jgi:ATP-dependent DNA helicase RecQ
VDVPRRKVLHALNLLEQAGAVTTTHSGRLLCSESELGPADAIDRALELADQHQRLIRSRIEMMRGYAETTGCRRRLLLGYFGEQLRQSCGNCDCCQAGTARSQPEADAGFALNSAVHHPHWGNGIVMFVEEDRLTVLFEDVGYKILSLPTVRSRHLLSATSPKH